MKEAFFQSIREEFPNEQVTRLIFADWCSENLPELEEKLRRHIPEIECGPLPTTHGNGLWLTLGLRYGFGRGFNYEANNHSGELYQKMENKVNDSQLKYKNFKLKMPELHKNQLILLPFGLVFFGYVAEQTGPYVFKLTNASLVVRHYANSWEEFASNEKSRLDLMVKNYGTITVGPYIITSMDWEGDLL